MVINLSSFIYYIFLFLFPIVPEFTRIGGRPSYQWVSIIALLAVLLMKKQFQDVKFIKAIGVGLMLFMAMYSIHGEYGSIVSIFIDCFAVLFVVYNEIDSYDKFYMSMKILVLGGILLSIESFIEFVLHYNIFSLIQTLDPSNSMGASILGFRGNLVRVEGSFGQSLPFAMYMLFINFICILVMKIKSNQQQRTTFVFKLGYILSIITIYLTTARMVLILTIILQMFFIVSLRPDRRALIISSGIIICLLVVITTPEVLDAIYFIPAIFNPDYYSKVSDGGQNIAYRLQLFSALGKYIKENPLIGLGYEKSKNLRFLIETPTSSWMAYSIDNNYLSYLAKYGLIGFTANIYPLVWIIRYTKKLRWSDKSILNIIGKWGLLIFVLYAVNLFSVFQMGEKRIFFILVGSILALGRVVNNIEDKGDDREKA